MKTKHIGYLLAVAAAYLPIASGQDLASDSLKPSVLFTEDFESYSIGSTNIDGQAPELETEPPANQGASIEMQAGSTNFGSKQLVVNEGTFTWETDAITLNEPILTSVSIKLTAIAGANGFDASDRVLVYAALGSSQTAPQPLLDVSLVHEAPANKVTEITGHLPFGTLSESRWDNNYEPSPGVRGGMVGALIRPASLRLVIVLESKRPGNYLALDDLIVSEGGFEGISDPMAWERQAYNNALFNVSAGGSRDTQSKVISASYRQSGLEENLAEMADDLCVGTTNPLEDPQWHPVRNVIFNGVDRFGTESILFTLDRPEEGWDSLTSWPGLFVCQEGAHRSKSIPSSGSVSGENLPLFLP